MCDVGGHISSDMITWQCACCGAAIKDSDSTTDGLLRSWDMCIVSKYTGRLDIFLPMKSGKKASAWIVHHRVALNDETCNPSNSYPKITCNSLVISFK